MAAWMKVFYRVSLLPFLMGILLLPTGCVMGGIGDMLQKSKIEATLMVRLPNDAVDLNFNRVNPSPDLALSFAYIRLRCSEQSYQALVKELGLQTVASNGDRMTYPISEGDWRLLPGAPSIPWWNTGTDTPPNAASRSYPDGNLVMKYERGTVYAVRVSGMVK